MTNQELLDLLMPYGFKVKHTESGLLSYGCVNSKGLAGNKVNLWWSYYYNTGVLHRLDCVNGSDHRIPVPKYTTIKNETFRDGFNLFPTEEQTVKYFVKKVTKKRWFIDNKFGNKWQVVLWRDDLNNLRPSVYFRAKEGKTEPWQYVHLKDRSVVETYWQDVYEGKAPAQIFWDMAIENGTISY